MNSERRNAEQWSHEGENEENHVFLRRGEFSLHVFPPSLIREGRYIRERDDRTRNVQCNLGYHGNAVYLTPQLHKLPVT
jgi:hypothetical protein